MKNGDSYEDKFDNTHKSEHDSEQKSSNSSVPRRKMKPNLFENEMFDDSECRKEEFWASDFDVLEDLARTKIGQLIYEGKFVVSEDECKPKRTKTKGSEPAFYEN